MGGYVVISSTLFWMVSEHDGWMSRIFVQSGYFPSTFVIEEEEVVQNRWYAAALCCNWLVGPHLPTNWSIVPAAADAASVKSLSLWLCCATIYCMEMWNDCWITCLSALLVFGLFCLHTFICCRLHFFRVVSSRRLRLAALLSNFLFVNCWSNVVAFPFFVGVRVLLLRMFAMCCCVIEPVQYIYTIHSQRLFLVIRFSSQPALVSECILLIV